MFKKAIILLLVTTFSGALLADEYVYSCVANTNEKIFSIGQSQNISIELNSGYLAIDNHSGIWNSLSKTNELDRTTYFKSVKTENSPKNPELVAFADSAMLNGANQGQLVLIKDINTQALTQEYNCKLATVRH